MPMPMALPEGVLLERDAVRGRHLVAARPYRRGELVLAQPPYRAVLDEGHSATHCDRTFAPARADQQLLRCSRSKLARYASRAAQKAAWRDGYKEECEALVRCAPRVPPPTVRLAARCLWRRQRDRDKPAEAAGGWQSYEALCSLQHHWDELPASRKQLYAQMAVLVRVFMRGAAAAADSSSASAGPAEPELWAPPQPADSAADEPPPDADEPDGLPSTKSIALLLARFAANAHTIADEELSPIGVGIFPLASMVNHSCTPSTTQVFSGSSIGFYAIAPIAVGEEITISYVELVASRQERRRALLSHYFFDIDVPAEPEPEPESREGWTTEPSPAGVLCTTAPAVSWRTDSADASLCALVWSDGVVLQIEPAGVSAAAGEASGTTASGVEVLPASGAALDTTAAAATGEGGAGTGGGSMTMLEQLLGSGLGGAKLWDQAVGVDPDITPEQAAAVAAAEQEEEEEAGGEADAMMGLMGPTGGGMGGMLGGGGMQQLPEGSLRPKHSAAAIDALPDDYGQRTLGGAAAGGDSAAADGAAGAARAELPTEVRIWGSDAAAAALRQLGEPGVQLLQEIAEAGWERSGGGRGVAALVQLLGRCDDLLGAADAPGGSGSRRLALGPGHVLRLRLQSALVHAAIAAGEWAVATSTAEALTPAYTALYPRCAARPVALCFTVHRRDSRAF